MLSQSIVSHRMVLSSSAPALCEGQGLYAEDFHTVLAVNSTKTAPSRLMHDFLFQGRKRNPNPNFLVRISSGGVGVFHVKGWGPKSSVCLSKPGETKLFGGISRDVCRDIPGAPESLKKYLCSILVPYNFPKNYISVARNIYWELISRNLHITYSFVIQRITWKNCFGIFIGKISFELHEVMFSEKLFSTISGWSVRLTVWILVFPINRFTWKCAMNRPSIAFIECSRLASGDLPI